MNFLFACVFAVQLSTGQTVAVNFNDVQQYRAQGAGTQIRFKGGNTETVSVTPQQITAALAARAACKG
jgi:hypothetical protein